MSVFFYPYETQLRFVCFCCLLQHSQLFQQLHTIFCSLHIEIFTFILCCQMRFCDIVFHYLPLLGREFCQDILLFLRQLNQFLLFLLFFLIKSLPAPLQRMLRHLLDNHFKDFLFVHNGTSFFHHTVYASCAVSP